MDINTEYINKKRKKALSDKRYYEKNKEKIKKYKHEYYLKNKDKIINRNRKWRKNNPVKYKLQNKKSKSKRRKKIYGATGSFTKEELLQRYKFQKGLCYWCLEPISKTSFHADHLIALANGGGNSINNIVCSCERCNLRKGSKKVDEWLNYLYKEVLNAI